MRERSFLSKFLHNILVNCVKIIKIEYEKKIRILNNLYIMST
jgi:hypothetical protein